MSFWHIFIITRNSSCIIQLLIPVFDSIQPQSIFVVYFEVKVDLFSKDEKIYGPIFVKICLLCFLLLLVSWPSLSSAAISLPCLI